MQIRLLQHAQAKPTNTHESRGPFVPFDASLPLSFISLSRPSFLFAHPATGSHSSPPTIHTSVAASYILLVSTLAHSTRQPYLTPPHRRSPRQGLQTSSRSLPHTRSCLRHPMPPCQESVSTQEPLSHSISPHFKHLTPNVQRLSSFCSHLTT